MSRHLTSKDIASSTEDIVAATRRLLSARGAREPDHVRENEALLLLADEMAQHPENVLQTLCELILDVCGAGSAGVSLLQSDTEDADFYWPAIAGAWSPYVGGGMPRAESPCGVVLERDAVLMFHDVVELFPAAAQGSPPITELLLAPFHQDGRPIGTVWALAHDPARRFDLEDERLLLSLARFAAAAYQKERTHKVAHDAGDQLIFLNQELGHLLKNTLSVIPAIASQSLKKVTERDLVDTFQRRIRALGAAHDVLLKQAWTAAPIHLIANSVLARTGQRARIDCTGPDITLGARATLALSLILHELATNALKHGSLTTESGGVTLSWSVRGDGDDAVLVIAWREHGGPPVEPAKTSGFGSRLINMGLLGNGGTTMRFEPDGLCADIAAPLAAARQA